MSADLHIHILESPATIQDFIHDNANVLGSKYFDVEECHCHDVYNSESMVDHEAWARARNQWLIETPCGRIGNTPNIWIGEVSWLKAALFEDNKYIPEPVMAVRELLGDDPVLITEEFIQAVSDALTQQNTTHYSVTNRVDEVVAFLRMHLGKLAYPISW
jgi:hypothetical protein